MAPGRSLLGLVVAGALLGAIVAAFFLLRGTDELLVGGGSGGSAAGAPEDRAAAGDGPSAGSSRGDAAGARRFDDDRGREGASGHIAADTQGPVDLIIVDETGTGLLQAGPSPLTPDVIFWLRPVLIEGRSVPASVPGSAKAIRRLGSRVSSTPGWYTAFDRPAGDAQVALAYGDRIVCIEPVQPGAGEVILVATEADIAALHCSVRGVIAGLEGAGHHVSVRPIGREGQVLAPILGEGEGDAFAVAKIPPGRSQLVVRFDPGVLVQKLIQSAPAGRPISLGARVVDADQWRFRLDALGRIRQPWLIMNLDLVPGEDRDLGNLVEAQAGAVLLALVDEAGKPVPAHSVDVRILSAPGTSIPHPQSWTFENLAVLHPLPIALLQMTVVQGDLGALISVRPSPLGQDAGGAAPGDAGFPETQGVLAPLSVVSLPESADAALLTESGAALASDPRWSGGFFKGHAIGERTMLVPHGRYRFEPGDGGAWSTVEVAADMFVDLRDSSPVSSPLRAADRKSRAAQRR